MKKRAVFLDRDGVLNEALVFNGKPHPPKSSADVKLINGVSEALMQLHESDWFLCVITNQPDVARGITSREEVEKINAHLKSALPLDEFLTCFHDNDDNCECRKPKPGALFRAARIHNIDLGASFMVGDRWSDVVAGKEAGCKTIFIDYKYNEKLEATPDYSVKSLQQAIEVILK